MIESLLNAVTKQLGTTFGNKYHYYVENIEQNLTKPCFTVDVILPTQRSISPVLYERTMPIVVYYFSDSKTNLKQDCYSMGEQIVECLEYLPFNNTLIRGEEISWHMVEDVLQLFITYQFVSKRVVEDEETIQTLETNVAHKQ